MHSIHCTFNWKCITCARNDDFEWEHVLHLSYYPILCVLCICIRSSNLVQQIQCIYKIIRNKYREYIQILKDESSRIMLYVYMHIFSRMPILAIGEQFLHALVFSGRTASLILNNGASLLFKKSSILFRSLTTYYRTT